MTTTDHEGLDWLLETLLARTPGARHALVLSRDGLKLCLSSGLSVDRADQLAAIASGIQALAHGASMEFGDGSGGVRQSMTEFHGGVLFIVEAGEGAHLAVVGEEYADAGVIGHHMNELVEQMGSRLRTDPRIASRTDPTAADGTRPGSLDGTRGKRRA
ncbi:roadblock/LC7 domain-containing protein [Actinacidiphila sp. ITFR-21]|uniref:roadblock/LC7 domain-containing protein n=1 Tax=Actinacidiphila sp. ITFR-21 TaxID=3075199 RepID=UPI00288B3607|nr:roadblock/LC7 domain-containing protein [Streptomyces sp. ITFR-21]WNI16736.1 roadblock/LC7 domain-containing protein [Streptomyces sp. ITFR-21]